MKTFELWKKTHASPFRFPVSEEIWYQSMFEDVDSDGRKLFDAI